MVKANALFLCQCTLAGGIRVYVNALWDADLRDELREEFKRWVVLQYPDWGPLFDHPRTSPIETTILMWMVEPGRCGKIGDVQSFDRRCPPSTLLAWVKRNWWA